MNLSEHVFARILASGLQTVGLAFEYESFKRKQNIWRLNLLAPIRIQMEIPIFPKKQGEKKITVNQ